MATSHGKALQERLSAAVIGPPTRTRGGRGQSADTEYRPAKENNFVVVVVQHKLLVVVVVAPTQKLSLHDDDFDERGYDYDSGEGSAC